MFVAVCGCVCARCVDCVQRVAFATPFPRDDVKPTRYERWFVLDWAPGGVMLPSHPFALKWELIRTSPPPLPVTSHYAAHTHRHTYPISAPSSPTHLFTATQWHTLAIPQCTFQLTPSAFPPTPPPPRTAVLLPIMYCVTVMPFQIFFVENTNVGWATMDIIITSECPGVPFPLCLRLCGACPAVCTSFDGKSPETFHVPPTHSAMSDVFVVHRVVGCA